MPSRERENRCEIRSIALAVRAFQLAHGDWRRRERRAAERAGERFHRADIATARRGSAARPTAHTPTYSYRRSEGTPASGGSPQTARNQLTSFQHPQLITHIPFACTKSEEYWAGGIQTSQNISINAAVTDLDQYIGEEVHKRLEMEKKVICKGEAHP